MGLGSHVIQFTDSPGIGARTNFAHGALCKAKYYCYVRKWPLHNVQKIVSV